MIVEKSIKIQAPPEEVFVYLNDVTNRSAYIPMLEEVVMLDAPPIRLGSRYIEVATIAGRKLETTYQVVAFEKNQLIRVKTLKSVFPIQADLNLQPASGGTEVGIRLQFTLSGIYRLGAPLIKKIVQQQAEEILLRLKGILEKG